MERKIDCQFMGLGPEFRSAKCLNLCELQLILSDQLRLPNTRSAEAQSLLKASYDYSTRFAKLRTRNVIVDLRSNLEREGDLHQYEIAQLVDLLPKSPDEAKALIPTLNRLPAPRLQRILDLLEMFRVHAA
ncbi:DNA-directed RNA polymerase II RPB4 [Besnoitia besnoiti]|uniref:DNA-directed RNA polymerase II RPB4 n=1 Tax=Besnoitia besnoiti TaxID=94643 RepID=A0A2A9MMQ0_BESBE|nr:DNA-directed RNA polymerase II RPB4 [Besnoitia besnoiti]PFH38654.1 DNA-directed RNA polymerase II RPB4 [Besnoitia besnoiti]